jgi:hypothetical protein
MAYNILYWCDSGANCDSCYRDEISTDELGLTEKEWDDLSEDVQAGIMRDIALDGMEWGYQKL